MSRKIGLDVGENVGDVFGQRWSRGRRVGAVGQQAADKGVLGAHRGHKGRGSVGTCLDEFALLENPELFVLDDLRGGQAVVVQLGDNRVGELFDLVFREFATGGFGGLLGGSLVTLGGS